MSEASGKLIDISQLRISFTNQNRQNHVIKGIDLHINSGEIVGLVGESGSGKSVTGLSLLGLLPQQNTKISGSISFVRDQEKFELVNANESTWNYIRGDQIAMIFQEPMSSLNPVFTCGYQVDEMTMLHLGLSRTQAKKKTLSLFQQVGLPDPTRIYNSYPHQISGGQIQRVMIAMAISCEPRLLIADEPTTALDVTVQKKIIHLLHEIRQKFGVSILFISHDLGVIKSISDRLYVMYKGTICESGETAKVLAHPQHPYTKGLIACKPPLHAKSAWLPVLSDFVEIKQDGDHFDFSPHKAFKVPKNEGEKWIKESDPLLKIEHLNVHYTLQRNFFGKPLNVLHALNDVSLDIFPGETVGVVGESGSGKSTLGRTILNLETPSSGSMYYEGKDLTQFSRVEWKAMYRNIQIIFQDPYSALNPKLRIGDAIMEPMIVQHLHGNSGQRKVKMLQLLDQVGLNPDHADRYPHEFSGGQRQRVCIARALAVNPRLIVCDEAVSALDVSVQAQVLNLLKQIQQDLGIAYLFITHDMSVVNFIADRVLVLHRGSIVEQGPSVEIISNPQKDYTKTLIESIPQWD